MELRPPGHTGRAGSARSASGAMMFGAWGETDHDESIRIIHRALDAGINFVDTADVYSARRVRGDRRQGARGRPPRRRGARDQGARLDGRRPEPVGNSRRWIVREVENSLRRLGTDWIDLYQIHRPEPDTDIDETLGALTDLVRPGKVRYIGSSTFPASQIVEAQWVRRAPRPRALRVRAAALLDARARASRRTCCPTCRALRHGRDRLEPARGRLAVGQVAQGRRRPRARAARAMLPKRYDLSIPANQRKLDAADALAQLAEEAGHDADRAWRSRS